MTRSALKAKGVLGALSLVFGALKFSLLIAGAAQAAVALSALVGGAVALVSAMGPLVGVVGLLPGMFLGLGVAALAVLPAFAGFSKGLAALATAEGEAQKNAISLAQSQQSLAAAELSVTRAAQDYANARRDAAEAIEDAQFGAADAQIAEERSVMALKKAYENLANVQAGIAGKTEEMTKVTDDFTGKQFEVARITFKSADQQENLQEALLGVREAELAVAKAKDANQDSQLKLNELQSKGIANSDIMIDRSAALASAILSVQQAQMALAEAQGAVTGEGTKEFKALSPAAQKFAKLLVGMKGKWDSLKKSTSEAMFPGLTDGVLAGGSVIDAILPGLTKVSAAVGNVGRQFGVMLGDKRVQKDLSQFIAGFAGHIRQMTPGLVSFAKGFLGLAIAAKPLADFLVGAFARGADRFEKFINAGRETGQLEEFFGRTVQSLKDWGTILGNIGTGFFNIFQAASPLGQSLVQSMIDVTQRFEDWTSSDAGQQKMAGFFTAIRGTISGLFGLLGDLGKAWGNLFMSPEANTGTQAVLDFFRNAVPYVQEFIKMFMDSDLFKAFSAAIVPIGTVLWTIFGPTGIAVLVVNTLGKIAEGFVWMNDNVPGFAEVLGTLITAFAAFKVISTVVDSIKALNLALMANPWVVVAAAVIALGILIYKNWDTIKVYLLKAWNWIKGVADKVWNSGIVKVIRKAVLAVVDVVMVMVRGIIRAWKFIWPAVEKVLDFIWGGIKFFWNVLKKEFEIGQKIIKGLVWVFQHILWPVIKKVVGWIVDILGGIWDILVVSWDITWAVLSGIWNGLVAVVDTLLIQPITSVVTTIWDGVVSAWNFMWAAMTLIWGGIKTAVTDWIITPLSGVFTTVWDGITAAWDTVWGILTGLWDGVSSAVGTYLIDPLASVFDGMWDGMKSGLVSTINFVIDMINYVITALNWVNPFDDIPYIPKLNASGGVIPTQTPLQNAMDLTNSVIAEQKYGIPTTPTVWAHPTDDSATRQANISGTEKVVINQTFNERQDPHAVAAAIAWRIS